jgi:hypothetical protein
VVITTLFRASGRPMRLLRHGSRVEQPVVGVCFLLKSMMDDVVVCLCAAQLSCHDFVLELAESQNSMTIHEWTRSQFCCCTIDCFASAALRTDSFL